MKKDLRNSTLHLLTDAWFRVWVVLTLVALFSTVSCPAFCDSTPNTKDIIKAVRSRSIDLWARDWSTDPDAPLDFVQSAKITFKFAHGGQELIDRGHGIELRSAVKFTDSLGLSTGVHEGTTTRPGGYVLLQWTMD